MIQPRFSTAQNICVGDIVVGILLIYARRLGQSVGMWAPTTPWSLVEQGLVHAGFREPWWSPRVGENRIDATDESRRFALFLVRSVLRQPEAKAVWVNVVRLEPTSDGISHTLGSEELWFEMSTNEAYGIERILLVGTCITTDGITPGDVVPMIACGDDVAIMAAANMWGDNNGDRNRTDQP